MSMKGGLKNSGAESIGDCSCHHRRLTYKDQLQLNMKLLEKNFSVQNSPR